MPENKVIDQEVINQALIGIVVGGVLIGISAFFGGAAYLHRKVNKKVTIMVHGSPRLVTPERAYELGIPSKFWNDTRGIWDSATTARNEEYWESRWTGKKPMLHEHYEAPPTTERDPWAQYRGAIVRAKEKAERRAMTKRAHSIAEYGELERRKRLGPSGVDLRHYEEEAPATDEGWAPPTLRSPR